MAERLPFLEEPKPAAIANKSDTKRLIELLEAIDWKLWMLYSMVSDGEVEIKKTNLDKNPLTDDKKTND